MWFNFEDQELHKQLLSILAVAAAAPGFWDFLKWLGQEISRILTGKKKVTNKDLSDDIKFLKADTERLQADVTEIKKDTYNQKEQYLEDKAIYYRSKILRFDDELRVNTPHSYEFYIDILETITKYNDYCKSHSNFKNERANSAIRHIMEEYDKAHKNNLFI